MKNFLIFKFNSKFTILSIFRSSENLMSAFVDIEIEIFNNWDEMATFSTIMSILFVIYCIEKKFQFVDKTIVLISFRFSTSFF